MKYSIYMILMLLLFQSKAQQLNNFTYSPENPQPGDIVTIQYKPLVDDSSISGFVLVSNTVTHDEVRDIKLEKNNGIYTAKVKTDSADILLAFGFYNSNIFDNNNNNNFYIILKKDGKPVRGAEAKAANLFSSSLGMYRFKLPEENNDEIIKHLKNELSLYPQDSAKYIFLYCYKIINSNKEQGKQQVLNEIDKLLKKGLTTEDDYQTVSSLYDLCNYTAQRDSINALKRQKYPSQRRSLNFYIQKFQSAPSLSEKENAIAELETAYKEYDNDPMFLMYLDKFRMHVATFYALDGNFPKFYFIADSLKDNLKFETYNNVSHNLISKDTLVEIALKLSKQASEFAEKEYNNPTENKPLLFTSKEWSDARKSKYSKYLDTYAMALYLNKDYDQARTIAAKVATEMNNGDIAEYNKTYVLAAEKSLSPSKSIAAIEPFFKNARYDSTMVNSLKNLYIAAIDKTGKGFDTYFASLEKHAYSKYLDELRTKLIDIPSPDFTLKNLTGNEISLSKLNDKTIILDFWATWCGPCKASFPAMQEMVNKYKGNEDIKFYFVNTWQSEKSTEQKYKAVSDYIKSSGYNFDVLMDIDSKVVSSYKIGAIPTKIVVKNGRIRYIHTGFEDAITLEKEIAAILEVLK